MEIRPKDAIFKIATPEKIKDINKSAGQGFNVILKDAIENYSKIDTQNQKPLINAVPQIHFNALRPEEKKPVGRVLSAEGKVMILRKDMKKDYGIKKDLPLFEGDTMVTQEKGRIRLRLNDGSFVTLAPWSELVINRSIYDSNKNKWTSSLNMIVGKAEFWVRKTLHMNRPEFKVKTLFAVCGARGSIFVVRTTHESTKVTTFEDTEIEVLNLVTPEVKPTILESFEWTVVKEGFLSSEVGKITPWEAKIMKQEFMVSPKVAKTEEKMDMLSLIHI